MRRTSSRILTAALAAIALWQVSLAIAADAPPRKSASPTSASGTHRELAPGVEVTIAADRQEDDTHAAHNIVEILQGGAAPQWTPKLDPTTRTLAEMSTGHEFRRNVWYLEFTFKPVRMMWVDVPQASGKMRRKLIWYLVYHVRNNGEHLTPKQSPAPDNTFTIQKYSQDVRFFPQFVLQAPETKKQYLDRIIPVAVAAIQQKEDPNRRLLNSVEIGAKPIPVSSEKVDRSVWGVATWEDLDPTIDVFSVAVQGLTNAYKWSDPAGAFKKGDPPGKGRVLTHKTLVLNFWRPGDEYVEDRRLIRFGAPGQVDYAWVYR